VPVVVHFIGNPYEESEEVRVDEYAAPHLDAVLRWGAAQTRGVAQ
jgi:hypothetical protein